MPAERVRVTTDPEVHPRFEISEGDLLDVTDGPPITSDCIWVEPPGGGRVLLTPDEFEIVEEA